MLFFLLPVYAISDGKYILKRYDCIFMTAYSLYMLMSVAADATRDPSADSASAHSRSRRSDALV